MKILVVDDQRELLQAIGLMLESEGFRFSLACGAESALERILQENFDLLLCDVQMPDMTGPELYSKIQSMGLSVMPRFIFMSGTFTEACLQKELGISGLPLLRKPFGLQALRAALLGEQNELGDRGLFPGSPGENRRIDQEAAM